MVENPLIARYVESLLEVLLAIISTFAFTLESNIINVSIVGKTLLFLQVSLNT